MNIVRPNVYVERPIISLGFVNKCYRCVHIGSGNLVTLHPTDWPVTERIGTERVLLGLLAIVGIKKWKDAWTEALEVCERLFKAVLRDQRRAADVALAA